MSPLSFSHGLALTISQLNRHMGRITRAKHFCRPYDAVTPLVNSPFAIEKNDSTLGVLLGEDDIDN